MTDLLLTAILIILVSTHPVAVLGFRRVADAVQRLRFRWRNR